MYYFFTFLASAAEISIPLQLWSYDPSLWNIGVAMSVYHLGYFGRDVARHRLNRPQVITIFVVSLATFVFALTVSILWLSYLSIFVFSSCIQTFRLWGKTQTGIKTLYKRTSRLGGFALGGPIGLSPYGLLVTGLLSMMPALRGTTRFQVARTPLKTRLPLGRKHYLLLFFEFFHHLHYFTYCYFLVIMLRSLMNSPVLVGLIFVAGWIGYAIIESKLRSFRPSLVVAGHIVCALVIFPMAFVDNVKILTLLWFLTGLGGGTAYALDYLESSVKDVTGPLRERYENMGHVLGPILGGAIALVWAQSLVFIVAAAVSLIAAVLISLVARLYPWSSNTKPDAG